MNLEQGSWVKLSNDISFIATRAVLLSVGSNRRVMLEPGDSTESLHTFIFVLEMKNTFAVLFIPRVQ